MTTTIPAHRPHINSVATLAVQGARFVEIVYEKGELRGNVSVLMTDRHASTHEALERTAHEEIARGLRHLELARLMRAAARKVRRESEPVRVHPFPLSGGEDTRPAA